jgi:VanZ family protein
MSVALLKLGFWLPLVLCTWLALVPDPSEISVFKISDVLLHAFAFTYLSFTLAVAYPQRSLPQIFCLMLGYGLLIEVVQSFEVSRSAELKDLLVDIVGIGFGLLLARLLAEWTRRLVSRLFDRTRSVQS